LPFSSTHVTMTLCAGYLGRRETGLMYSPCRCWRTDDGAVAAHAPHTAATARSSDALSNCFLRGGFEGKGGICWIRWRDVPRTPLLFSDSAIPLAGTGYCGVAREGTVPLLRLRSRRCAFGGRATTPGLVLVKAGDAGSACCLAARWRCLDGCSRTLAGCKAFSKVLPAGCGRFAWATRQDNCLF